MGTRGLSDWGRLLMGSVAHKVVHLAEVPVLVVR
jgi:nucleotide-binding universal stress UspA family protein